MKDIGLILRENAYPGRGIILGKSADGRSAVCAYFIMGRSESSRGRVFEEDGKGLRVKIFGGEKNSAAVDTSLIVYSPVRVCGNILIVTNGDQTDTVYGFIRDGDSFDEALRTRRFEPDSPLFTPRISGALDLADCSYRLAVLKAYGGKDNPRCARYFYEYESANAGEGHFIHTYKGDGAPPPPFEGEPVRIKIPAAIKETSEMLWDSLNSDNKVSLFVRFTDLKTKKYETKIINKLS